MKKRTIATLLLGTMLLSTCVGCSGQVDEEPELEYDIEFNLDAYQNADGMLRFTDSDGTVNETGGLGILMAEGQDVATAMEESGYSNLEAFREGDTLEGWMECELVSTVDEDGFESSSWAIVSEKLYTMDELMALTASDHNMNYVAKWASIPMEDYFVTEAWDAVNTAGIFTFSANGGSMTFRDSDESEYTCAAYSYWLEDEQALNDVMGTDFYAALVDTKKDGSTFTGWTLYQADSIYWNSEPVEEDGLTSFPFDPENEDVQYVLLENGQLIRENASTEELCGISVEGKCYFALANWQ